MGCSGSKASAAGSPREVLPFVSTVLPLDVATAPPPHPLKAKGEERGGSLPAAGLKQAFRETKEAFRFAAGGLRRGAQRHGDEAGFGAELSETPFVYTSVASARGRLTVPSSAGTASSSSSSPPPSPSPSPPVGGGRRWAACRWAAVGLAVCGLAVGGVVLGDHLTGGGLGAADAAGDAARAVADWAPGAAADAAEWATGAAEDVADWAPGAAADAAEWGEGVWEDAVDGVEGAGESVTAFVTDAF